MEAKTLIFSFLFIVLSLRFLIGKLKQRPNLPPSPAWALPVIGHLLLLKLPLHRTFLSISKSLSNTPIFSLRLGNRLVFVVSSHSIAEECFTKNDVVLANRPETIVSKHVGYDCTNMISASYGDLWRNLRRIGAVEIFSTHRLNSFLSIRQDEIRRLILRLSQNFSQEFVKVEMGSMLSDLTFNNIIMMVAGKRYYGVGIEDDPEAKRVRKLIADVVSSASAGNAADYLPFLRWVSNFETRVKKLGARLDEFFQRLVDEKREAKEKGNTMIDHLLSLQESQPEFFTDRIIKGNMFALILAGTDTSAVTLEWALSNLLNHPEVLSKARDEINRKIGYDRLMNESDISNLLYLQNIVSETLRLYPTVPMLLSHVASEDCKVGGYDMPCGTTLLTNVWAIHRDPRLWDDPKSFKPERFEKDGEAQKLMAFGLGRRSCPGSGLAQRLITLTLGSLIQCFDWERVGEEKVDMREGKGLSMPKEKPLELMCRARAFVALKKLTVRLDEFFQGLVDEKREAKEKGTTTIDHLLSLQDSQPEFFTDTIIKGIIVDLILAGTLEWALSNLLNHPEVMNKARDEIDKKIGSKRIMEESDISNLPYLQNIVSETLRLHPPAPLLIHVASEDCKVGGYDMPRGKMLLVNVWAIHRDPRLWDDPTCFKPERFEKEGEAQKLMAFGLGRRACPGYGLAQRLISLTLGSLIQCFDWERVGEEKVDMREGKGLSMPKEKPLELMCRARAFVGKIIHDTA